MKKKIFFLTILILLFFPTLLLAQEKTEFPKELTGDQLYQEGLKRVEQEKYQEAVLYFEEATKRKANFAEAYYQLGLCYIKLLDPEKAKQNLIFAKILSIDETLKQKAIFLIEKLPEEIEKEKRKQEEEERRRQEEERRRQEEERRRQEEIKKKLEEERRKQEEERRRQEEIKKILEEARRREEEERRINALLPELRKDKAFTEKVRRLKMFLDYIKSPL